MPTHLLGDELLALGPTQVLVPARALNFHAGWPRLGLFVSDLGHLYPKKYNEICLHVYGSAEEFTSAPTKQNLVVG